MLYVAWITLHNYIFIFIYVKEIEVSRKGKECDFFIGKKESIEVRIFAL